MANLINKTMLDRGTKKCYRCKKHKSLSEFSLFNGGSRGGKKRGQYISNDCLECGRNNHYLQYREQRMLRKDYTKPKECEACGDEAELCFDHCHITDLFRGWICKACNSTLGWAKDDPDRLRALAEYIEKFYRSEAVLALLK